MTLYCQRRLAQAEKNRRNGNAIVKKKLQANRRCVTNITRQDTHTDNTNTLVN